MPPQKPDLAKTGVGMVVRAEGTRDRAKMSSSVESNGRCSVGNGEIVVRSKDQRVERNVPGESRGQESAQAIANDPNSHTVQ